MGIEFDPDFRPESAVFYHRGENSTSFPPENSQITAKQEETLVTIKPAYVLSAIVGRRRNSLKRVLARRRVR